MLLEETKTNNIYILRMYLQQKKHAEIKIKNLQTYKDKNDI
jgi:hypothetical protein